jgi:cytochrome c-type biogenesis protein CcsB
MKLRSPAVLLVLGLPATLAAAARVPELATLAIQDGGRVKPLDTFGRETARRVVGAKPFGAGESVGGLDPAEWVLSMLADSGRWRAEPIVRVTHAGLREAVELPAGKDRFSFSELAAHEPFLRQAEALHERLRENPQAQVDPVEREVLELYDTLNLMAGIFSGEALRIVPASGDARAEWSSVAELGAESADPRLRALVAALVSAQRASDRAGAAAAAAALRARLAECAPGAYPKLAELQREEAYNRTKPFRRAWLLYLAGFLLLLSSLPAASRALALAGFAAVAAGFAFNSQGLLLRTLISGRAPVTNMYESVLFVAWGAVLVALLFEVAYRARWVGVCASGLATLCLVLADSVPILDSSIAPLVPVLRDNFWLTTHVLTITLGYAAFLLAMGIAHLNLGLYFFAPRRVAQLKTLTLFLYRALQVGTLFLAAGTMLGGIWASYSWGRFWGWDPKETWSLIALLGYLAVLHGRFLGWFKELGLAVGAILGFMLVLMAWYGVNFILGTGLHSYGFGSGGYTYVAGFVAFELLVIAAAAWRWRSERGVGELRAALPVASRAH